MFIFLIVKQSGDTVGRGFLLSSSEERILRSPGAKYHIADRCFSPSKLVSSGIDLYEVYYPIRTMSIVCGKGDSEGCFKRSALIKDVQAFYQIQCG